MTSEPNCRLHLASAFAKPYLVAAPCRQYGPHGSGAYYRRPAGSGGYSSFYGRPPPRQQPQYTWGSDEEGEEYYGGAYSSAGAWDYY